MDIRNIIEVKKTRLCFSADFTKKKILFEWINLLGPHICILKTHIDILEDFDNSVIDELLRLKKKYNFLILEDRKFADIGKTFLNQLYNGIYKIGLWADIITIHGITCDGMLNILGNNSPKILIVAQMSSSNNIITDDYTQKCYKIALKYPKKVLGFITQKRFIEDSNFLFLTPGVKIVMENVLDQNYRTPKQAIEEDGNDIIIVGSGIYNSKKGNIEDIIEKYKFI